MPPSIPFSQHCSLFDENPSSLVELPFSAPTNISSQMGDAGFSKNSASSMKPISLVGRHCYPFFRDHLHNPYPTSQEKESIVSEANSPDVTMVSVSNWFANSRRRSGWIELCNEYYNGDTKLMVEICSHVLINGGESRSNDPPTLVDKILKMERKVQSWHEGEIQPSSWAVALHDLLLEFETRLQLDAKTSQVEHPVVPEPGDQDEGKKTHSVVSRKRSLNDYISGSYTSDILPRSASVSSISSSSSECYSSEDEERPTKRGRIHTGPTENGIKSSSESLNPNQHRHSLRPDSNQLKRPLSVTSFYEESVDYERMRKRFHLPDIGSQGNSHESLIQDERPLDDSPHSTSSRPIIQCSEIPDHDISLIPTADLQPPDATWSLDINLYDWSSSPDILSMMDPSIHPVQEDCFHAFMNTVTEDKVDDTDQWLQSFFTSDLSETDALSSSPSETVNLPITPSTIQSSSYADQSSLTFKLEDATRVALDNSYTVETQRTTNDQSNPKHKHESSLTLPNVDNVPWQLSSDFGSDPFPTDFPEAFLSESSSPPFPTFPNPCQCP